MQDALTAAVAEIAECEVPESLVRQMGEGECASGPLRPQPASHLSYCV